MDLCPNKEFLFECIDRYDILFLDIELGDENGIDLELELRQRCEKCIIIIASNFAKYVFDGYKIHADRYFVKPIQAIPCTGKIKYYTLLLSDFTCNFVVAML